MAEYLPQQETVMVGKTIPLKRRDQFGDPLLGLPLRKLRDFLLIPSILK